MKKVLIMTNGLYSGGAEKVLQTLLNNLDFSKFDVTLYSMHQRELDPEFFTTKDKYRYKSLFKKHNSKIACFLQKIKGKMFKCLPPSVFGFLFLREKFDVEIAFLEGEATKVISGSPNKKSKKIAWVHTDLIKNNWTDYLYSCTEKEAEAYSKYDKIVCVSESVKKAFIEKYGISDTVIVRYNPIDSTEVLEKAKEKADVSAEHRPLLVTTGRLEAPKGYERLLQCAGKLHKEGLEFTLWILGDGTLRETLETYISENDLSGNVKLLGFQDNPYKFVARSDAFICSSYIEGFSTAAAESIILGKPVYTLDCPGMKELFGNEKCGEIVPNTDEDLYNLFKRAVTEQNLLCEYTASARNRSAFFDIRKRIEDIENLI